MAERTRRLMEVRGLGRRTGFGRHHFYWTCRPPARLHTSWASTCRPTRLTSSFSTAERASCGVDEVGLAGAGRGGRRRRGSAAQPELSAGGEPELVEQREHVPGHRLAVVTMTRHVGSSEPAQVRAEHPGREASSGIMRRQRYQCCGHPWSIRIGSPRPACATCIRRPPASRKTCSTPTTSGNESPPVTCASGIPERPDQSVLPRAVVEKRR
jgi:hypothetical protein